MGDAMTKCKRSIALGSHTYQSGKTVMIDRCVINEIQELLSQGINTEMSCCGHRGKRPWVTVLKADKHKMIDLGYEWIKDKSEQPVHKEGKLIYTFPEVAWFRLKSEKRCF